MCDRGKQVLPLFVRHQTRIKGFISSLMGDFAALPDVLQGTFLVVQRKAGEFEPGSNFVGWTFQIARFQVMKTQTQHKRATERFRCGGRESNFLAVRAAVLLSVVLSLITGGTAWGATYTWDGGGGDGAWTTADNWDGTVPTAGNCDSTTILIFGGTAKTIFTRQCSEALARTITKRS